MGNYLSAPIIDKESIDEESDKIAYGASAMQGWRTDQEDAHNCILEFDENSSLFAVYDGHGGKDVSKYCSLYLPEFIKSVSDYKKGNISEALEKGFLDFDLTLKTQEVKAILDRMNGSSELIQQSPAQRMDELYLLREDAKLPVHDLIEKYQLSPTPNALDDNCVVNGANNNSKNGKDTNGSSSVSVSQKSGLERCENSNEVPNNVKDKKLSDDDNTVKDSNEGVKNGSKESIEIDNVPGCSSSSSMNSNSSSSSAHHTEPFSRLRPKEAVQLIDSSDEDDSDSDAEYDEEKDSNEDTLALGDDDDDDDEEEDDDEDQFSDEDSTSGEEEYEHQGLSEPEIAYQPAEDSGCTACLALIKDSVLYVANVGDSRCIVCRKGIAVEMSCDHKPEDEVETARIKAAGGQVTEDGRVNGGLNLSRALGDHLYKKGDVPAKEQMISAQPDIQTLKLNSGDEFMVIACDGIWNTMSSQEVVDFVLDRIDNTKKLSKISEEMFMHCLSPDTTGDGTGCDNMTAIIVKFKPAIIENVTTKKRRLDSDSDLSSEENSKVKKTKA